MKRFFVDDHAEILRVESLMKHHNSIFVFGSNLKGVHGAGAAKDALDSHGFGMASVRFICGTQDLHKTLESRIAALENAVKALENFHKPVPEWSRIAPPVVPARSITRSVLSPVPR